MKIGPSPWDVDVIRARLASSSSAELERALELLDVDVHPYQLDPLALYDPPTLHAWIAGELEHRRTDPTVAP